MSNLPLIDSAPLEEDIAVEKSLRPSYFDEFIGQKDNVDSLKLYIEAANKRGEALDHVLDLIQFDKTLLKDLLRSME